MPVGAVFGAANAIADGFASLISPPLTPKQKLEQETATREREAKDQHQAADSNYLTARQAEKHREEELRRSHDRER